jgi:hypothetical protein
MKLSMKSWGLAGAMAAALVSASAFAAPTVYTEGLLGTGALPGAADNVGAAEGGLKISGRLTDGKGGNAANLVDMYKFNVGYAGTYFFNTQGTSIVDTQLFLFDSSGKGLAWNNDVDLASGNTQSAFSTFLGLGDYYIALSFWGVDPEDEFATPVFDTLGTNDGPANAGAGAVANWADFYGNTSWDLDDYAINAYVPEPGALALSLAALALMAGVSRRRVASRKS